MYLSSISHDDFRLRRTKMTCRKLLYQTQSIKSIHLTIKHHAFKEINRNTELILTNEYKNANQLATST